MTTVSTTVTRDDITVQVLDAAEHLDAADWAAVSEGRGFYTSRPWLRSLEDDPWHDVWYLAARDGAGRLLGLLPAYLNSGLGAAAADAYYDPAGVLSGPGVPEPDRWRPALLAGGRAGYETDLLLRPGLPGALRSEVISALAARLGRLAGAWQVPLSAFMHVRPSAAAELAATLPVHPLLTEVTAVIELAGTGSFERYVAELPKRRRARVRTEVREFQDSDLTIRQRRLSDSVEVLAPLLAAHHRRYGHRDTPDMLAAHLRQQAGHLDEYGRVLLCEHAGATLGALLVYEWADTWYVRAVATDERMRGRSAAFFNLLYYAPVRMALERGISRYVIGPSNLAAKVWRGAVVEPRWSVLIDHGGAGVDLGALAAAWNDAQQARWADELASIGAPTDITDWRHRVSRP